MQTGTISDLSPQDGLGWITLDEGPRVRFGATACKGFVPSVGVRVSVVGTAPGYGGVVKATQVVPLPKTATAAAAASAKPKREYLSKLELLKKPVDDILRSIVARAETDDAFDADLQKIGFAIVPQWAPEIDTRADLYFIVARDVNGSDFGLYMTDAVAGMPWVFWDHDIDRLAYVAPDTLAFFSGLIAEYEVRTKDSAVAERMRGVMRELGVAIGPFPNAEGFLEGQPAKWLPRMSMRR